MTAAFLEPQPPDGLVTDATEHGVADRLITRTTPARNLLSDATQHLGAWW